MVTLPHAVTVAPGPRPLAGAPTIPGAKYAMVRATLAAALADGSSTVAGVPWTEDTDVLLGALRALGVAIEQTGPETIQVTGCGGRFPVTGPVAIEAGNAGAVLRFLLGVGATVPEVRFTTGYPASLGLRPNEDLLAALQQLGVEVAEAGPQGTLPITLRRARLHGGPVTIAGVRGSQYLSALLFLAPLIGAPVAITVTDGLRSASFIRLTLATLRAAGLVIDASPDLRQFVIPGNQRYQVRDWRLARDWPTAGMWLAAGALTGGALSLGALDMTAEDGIALRAALAAFGVELEATVDSDDPLLRRLNLASHLSLHGADLDGEPVIDSVPVLAALASCASGTTTIRNVASLRLKESDRIGDLCAELRRAGAIAHPGEDTIAITGQPDGLPGGTTVDAHHDHRLAMALALVALRCRMPLTITGAQHVAKSYPTFWDELARLGARVSEEALQQDEVTVIETNLDDTPGEVLGWLMERLFAAGALDVSFMPLQMKKNRPGILVRVIARPEDTRKLAALIVRETPTLGVRLMPMQRLVAERRQEVVTTPQGTLTMKLKLLAGQIVAASPEYEDCRRIALEQELPLAEVMARLDAWARDWYHLEG